MNKKMYQITVSMMVKSMDKFSNSRVDVKEKDYVLLLCEIIQSKPYLATKEENRGGLINPESSLCTSINIRVGLSTLSVCLSLTNAA
jgi:hypothetical protein